MGSAARQSDFFDRPKRRNPRVMMHVSDAGESDVGGKGVQLTCGKCGHITGWLEARTVSEERRGRPCPICNQENPDAKAE